MIIGTFYFDDYMIEVAKMPISISDMVGFAYTYVSYRQQEEANELLRQMVTYQKESLAEIQSLRQDIQSIINGHYHSALLFLGDASKPHRTSNERDDLVHRAYAKYIEVLGILGASISSAEIEKKKAMIQTDIALCWLILNSKEDTLEWIEKAINTYYVGYESEKQFALKRIKNIEDEIESELKDAVLGALNLNPIYSLLYEFKKRKTTVELNELKEEKEGSVKYFV